MIMMTEYEQAVEQAKAECADLAERGEDALGETLEEFEQELLSKGLITAEEIGEDDLQVAVISEMIKARQDKGISQRKLEELSGVKQPMIARIEKGTTDPQLKTLLKVIGALGYTLKLTPLHTV